jgi:acyl-CoA reductase-like NAD-dependent aldehyde dehydrogenase
MKLSLPELKLSALCASIVGHSVSADHSGALVPRNTNGELGELDCPLEFYSLTASDLETMMTQAVSAGDSWAADVNLFSVERREKLAKAILENIDHIRPLLLQALVLEKGRTEAEWDAELNRGLSQVQQILDAMLAGEIDDAVRDFSTHAGPKGSDSCIWHAPGTSPGLVMDPNNFPVAFGWLGYGLLSMVFSGHSVIYRPHENHTLSGLIGGWYLAQICKALGFCEHLVQTAVGGIPVVEQLMGHAKLKMLSFTGGRRAMIALRKLNAQRVLNNLEPLRAMDFEIDGINPAVYFDSYLETGAGSTEGARLIGTCGFKGGAMCTVSNLLAANKASSGDMCASICEAVEGSAPTKAFDERSATAYMEMLELRKQAFGGEPTATSAGFSEGNSMVPFAFFVLTYSQFLENVELWTTEHFGPCFWLIQTESDEQLLELVKLLPRDYRNLAGQVFYNDGDCQTGLTAEIYQALANIVTRVVRGYAAGLPVGKASAGHGTNHVCVGNLAFRTWQVHRAHHAPTGTSVDESKIPYSIRRGVTAGQFVV